MKLTGIVICFILFSSNVSGQRGTFTLFTDEEIQSLASEQYQRVIAANTVLDSARDADAEMVQKVGQRIFDAVKKYYGPKRIAAELKNYVWQIRLVNKKDINAVCLPGARFVIGTGMLDWAHNEGSVAVVLAHEIAHILYGHGKQRVQQALQELTGGKKLSELLSEKPAVAKDIFLAAYGGGNVALFTPFSLEQEKEADKLGMILAGIAGYNPRETIVFWERMERLTKTARQPILMSSHRGNEERQEQMQEIVDDIVKKYYHPPK